MRLHLPDVNSTWGQLLLKFSPWLALIALAGCKGIPTQGERIARQEFAAVQKDYRPQNRPVLPELNEQSRLQDFLHYAMLNHPEIEAAYYDWAASVERITVARSFPDPQITFQMDIQSIVTSIMPGFMLNFPGPGKLRAQADVASTESQAKYFAFETSVLQTALAVKKAYYQLYFLDRKIQINKQNLSLLSDLEKLARTQNEVGKVTLQDVLRAQIEQERLQADVANLEDSRAPLLAQFKAALGLKTSEAVPPLPGKFESTSLEMSSDQLFETALARNPRLKEMEVEVRTADASIRAAEKMWRPDSSLGLMADVKMNPILFRPLGGVSLPIWRDKIAAQIAEAQAKKQAAQARLSGEQINLAVDFAEKNYLVREANRNLALLREQLIPKTRQSLEIARSGYLSGQIDFLNIIDTERSLLGFGVAEVDAQVQRELALADLSLGIVGKRPQQAPWLKTRSKQPQGEPSKDNSSNMKMR